MKKGALFVSVLLCLVIATGAALALEKSRGQAVYIPASYTDSSDYDPDGNLLKSRITLTQLNIRNADPGKKIMVKSVQFYDPDGQLVKEYLAEPEVLDPLASVTFNAEPSILGIPPYDRYDGRPSFVVKWRAQGAVVPPLVEAVWIVIGPGSVPGTTLIEGVTAVPGKAIQNF
jgi:hypothetical protein